MELNHEARQLISHTTACARLDRTGLDDSRVRTLFFFFKWFHWDQKSFVIYTLTTLCCAFVLFFFKSSFCSKDVKGLRSLTLQLQNEQINKMYPSLPHSTLHIKSACITSLLVVFGTNVCFTLYLVLFANRQLINEHLLGLVVQQMLQSFFKKEN